MKDDELYEDHAESIIKRGVLLLAVAVLLLCASSADACQKCGLFGNKCAFRQVQAVHVQQVVTPQVYLGAPSINYFVGQEVRVEAIVQQALRQDPGYAEYQKFRAWQAGQAQQQAAAPPVQPDPLNKPTETIPQNIPTSLLVAKCSQCHGGDAPKAGLLIDGTAKLTCEQMARAMKRVQDGSMPPKGTLTGEERGDVFQELLDLVDAK